MRKARLIRRIRDKSRMVYHSASSQGKQSNSVYIVLWTPGTLEVGGMTTSKSSRASVLFGLSMREESSPCEGRFIVDGTTTSELRLIASPPLYWPEISKGVDCCWGTAELMQPATAVERVAAPITPYHQQAPPEWLRLKLQTQAVPPLPPQGSQQEAELFPATGRVGP